MPLYCQYTADRLAGHWLSYLHVDNIETHLPYK